MLSFAQMTKTQDSVTIRWIAEKAGVSVATVSRAIRQPNTVASKTRERILKLVEQYQFVPDGRAATFSSRRTGVIGLIVPTISNSIYAEFTEAVQTRLQTADLSLLIANANYSAETERDIIRRLIESRVEGIILTGFQRDPALYQLLQRYQIPFVVTWATSPDSNIPSISFDNRSAAIEATEALLKLGHRRIGLICGMTGLNDRAAQRFDGYRFTLNEYGIAFDPALVAEKPFEIGVAAEAAAELMQLQKPPTALFCANDIQALGALFACQKLNIRVPDDVSIIGFDDLPFSRIVTPALSTIHVPATHMGGAAAEALIGAIRESAAVVSQIIPTTLILRDSIAKVASKASVGK